MTSRPARVLVLPPTLLHRPISDVSDIPIPPNLILLSRGGGEESRFEERDYTSKMMREREREKKGQPHRVIFLSFFFFLVCMCAVSEIDSRRN